MNLKSVLGMIVALSSISATQVFACDEHGHKMVDTSRPIMNPTSEMEGQVCFPYRYTSESNKTQTLGTLKPRGVESTAGTQDVKPKAFSNEDLTAEKKVVKPKKRKVAKAKPAVQKDAYNEEVKPAATSTATDAPVVQPTPVAPEQPKVVTPEVKVEAPAQPKVEAPKVETPKATETPSVTPQAPTDAKPSNSSMVLPQGGLQPSLNTDLVAPTTKVTNLEFSASEVDISPINIVTLSSLVSDLKASQNLKAKIQSYAFSDSGNISDARRMSLQRAIKIRKYLIDNDINPSRISVNAIEDSAARTNKVEIQLEPSL